jgi:cytochrome c5
MLPNRIARLSVGLAGCVLPLVLTLQAQSAAKQTPADKTSVPSQVAQHKHSEFHSEGERIFAQNCSRCHNAPDGFSPHISATVIRHMRVRAQLSQHDEQELLRFLNP